MFIEIIAAGSAGATIGFFTCAALTAGKVADVQIYNASQSELRAAHTRCADALVTTQRKLSEIRDLLSNPATIRKGQLAAILDGDL